MLAALASYGPGHWDGGGPGAWIIFPFVFWALVASAVGFAIWRRTPRRSARYAAERILAERYARGEISEQELTERRSTLRRKS
jgi:putative membrane protein